jgi:hypothetical protein
MKRAHHNHPVPQLASTLLPLVTKAPSPVSAQQIFLNPNMFLNKWPAWHTPLSLTAAAQMLSRVGKAMLMHGQWPARDALLAPFSSPPSLSETQLQMLVMSTGVIGQIPPISKNLTVLCMHGPLTHTLRHGFTVIGGMLTAGASKTKTPNMTYAMPWW